jgi:hypothetical protein
MTDRILEIKARWEKAQLTTKDVDWLISEVERLRAELRKDVMGDE